MISAQVEGKSAENKLLALSIPIVKMQFVALKTQVGWSQSSLKTPKCA